MPISAHQLGSELIRRSAARDRPISNLSLQKLAYFAHGWHLALVGEPLVNDTFEAWEYGPVLSELYHRYKGFSSNPIPADHPLVASEKPLNNKDISSQIIDRVLEVYGDQTSFGLVELSHDPRGPWYPAYHDPGISSNIPNDSIRDYFRSLQAGD